MFFLCALLLYVAGAGFDLYTSVGGEKYGLGERNWFSRNKYGQISLWKQGILFVLSVALGFVLDYQLYPFGTAWLAISGILRFGVGLYNLRLRIIGRREQNKWFDVMSGMDPTDANLLHWFRVYEIEPRYADGRLWFTNWGWLFEENVPDDPASYETHSGSRTEACRQSVSIVIRRMRKKDLVCYAAALGGCSHIQSKEHYFTQGIFSNKMITVEGQKWIKGESATVSKATLGLRILCTAHNNQLTQVDRAAIEFSRETERLQRKSYLRSDFGIAARRPIDRVSLDGKMLERWFLKYVLGVIFEDPANRWHPSGDLPDCPPIDALRCLFDGVTLSRPKGLYLILETGDEIRAEERVGAETLIHPATGHFCGAAVNIRNFNFLLWLADENLALFNFASRNGRVFGPGGSSAMYHPQGLHFNAKGNRVGELSIAW